MRKTIRDTSRRREKIGRMLREDGSVQVIDLSAQFEVSTVTIRKDLKFLEDQGVATRSYGGAILSDNGVSETEVALEKKRRLHAQEKSFIGEAAAALINPGDSIILDSGSTTMQIASHLPDQEGVTIVTNGLNVVNELARHEQHNVMFVGGTLRRKNMSFYGSHAENALKDLHVDKLFLGVDGFHMERGITTHFEQEALLNRLMCKASTEIIVVTDSSKFDKVCLHKILAANGIDKMVTDSQIPADYADGLKRLGVELIIADAD